MEELWEFECSGEPGLVLSILLNLRTMRLVLLVPVLQGLEYIVQQEERQPAVKRGQRNVKAH